MRQFLVHVLAATALLLGAGSASAASLQLSAPDDAFATAAVAISITGDTTGKTGSTASLFTSAVPGTTCPALDSAEFYAARSLGGGPQSGAISVSPSLAFDTPGTWVLCGWIVDGGAPSAPVLASTSRTLAVKPITASLTVTAPATLNSTEKLNYTVTARADVARPVSVYVFSPLVTDCPATPAAANHMNVGGVLLTATPEGSTAAGSNTVNDGTWLLCGWVLGTDATTPIYTMPAVRTTVSTDVKPCVVPVDQLVGASANDAPKILHKAGCVLGNVDAKPSTKFPDGAIIGVVQTGTYPGNTKIDVVASLGGPCKVPNVIGMTLKGAEGRLTKANCVPGKTIKVKSTRAKGHVVRLSSRAGKTLKAKAFVTIYISKG